MTAGAHPAVNNAALLGKLFVNGEGIRGRWKLIKPVLYTEHAIDIHGGRRGTCSNRGAEVSLPYRSVVSVPVQPQTVSRRFVPHRREIDRAVDLLWTDLLSMGFVVVRKLVVLEGVERIYPPGSEGWISGTKEECELLGALNQTRVSFGVLRCDRSRRRVARECQLVA